jgi:hypothetical protein
VGKDGTGSRKSGWFLFCYSLDVPSQASPLASLCLSFHTGKIELSASTSPKAGTSNEPNE